MLSFKTDEMKIKDDAARLRAIRDAVPHLDMFKADVESGLYAQQLVTVALQELFRHEFPETKWVNGGLIAMDTSVNEGALEYSYQEVIRGGRAAIVAPNATDIPSADVEGRNNLREIQTVAVEFGFSTQDIRTARLQGRFDIASEKGAAAREAHDRTMDDLLRSGNEAAGLRGATNAPGITVVPAVNGTWQSATGVDIVEDFRTAANTATNGTDAVEMPDTALFDVASWTRISTLVHLPAASDRTVLSFLREAFPMIRRWDWEPGLKTADQAGTGPAVMIYRNERSKLRSVNPMMLRFTALQQKGLMFKAVGESRFGGVIVPRPRSVVRLDGV